ncbi:MAG: RIP metalloprotease RseP [Rickettsia endosymbiont of Bryobia graminum]|nr:RIP metalloprotease RseP [Rickettsia endosymbiont of Bryobia graminum]
MLSLFGFIFTISFLVFIHEFGHYYVAKFFGMKIEEFSIGFGKTLFSRVDKDNVNWKICALPFGGYVKIQGFNSTNIQDNSFRSKPLYAQFLTIFAGPAANYLLAIIIFTAIYCVHGQVEIPPIIGEVVTNSPAEKVGLLENDKIIMVGNNKIKDFADLQRNILINGKENLHLIVERKEEVIDISVTPEEITRKINNTAVKALYIGIIPKNEPILIKLNIFQSLHQAFTDVIYISKLILQSLEQMIIGTKSLDGLGGPIAIAKESGKSLDSGVTSFGLFLAMISINLGLLNFLPIPVLDGGYLIFIMYEAVTKKAPSERVKNAILKIGMIAIIFLIVISISNDIKSLVF